MKFRVEIDGAEYGLELRNGAGNLEYALTGVSDQFAGAASIAAAGPGAYSLLLADRSYTVRLSREPDHVVVQIADRRYRVRVSDMRDRRSKDPSLGEGPLEIRSQMPGKVVKLLIEIGQTVEAGEGLMVVEAMKMQNEIRAPKSGVVSRIFHPEGATVAAGEVLLVIT